MVGSVFLSPPAVELFGVLFNCHVVQLCVEKDNVAEFSSRAIRLMLLEALATPSYSSVCLRDLKGCFERTQREISRYVPAGWELLLHLRRVTRESVASGPLIHRDEVMCWRHRWYRPPSSRRAVAGRDRQLFN